MLTLKDSNGYVWYETTFTVEEFQWTTTIDGEPAFYCPAAKEYIPARCCPRYCSKKRSCTARR